MPNFAVLTPPFVLGAAEANEQIFARGNVLGIEVTIPAFVRRCDLGNIDPQHTGADIHTSAIEAALNWPLPSGEVTMFTVRADLDSIGAMAVLAWRLHANDVMRADLADLGDRSQFWGLDLTSWKPNELSLERIRLVGEVDRFGTSSWPGTSELPTQDNRWPTGCGSLDSTRRTAVMQAVCLDARLSVAKRVELVWAWLQNGEEPTEYVARVESARDSMISALEHGEITVHLVANDQVAVVESRHAAALQVGYSHAPVVVAINDRFVVGGSEPHTKVTICQYGRGGKVNLGAVFAELNNLEFGDPRPKNGWGGSPTVGGSPQGVSTNLFISTIVEVVTLHLG